MRRKVKQLISISTVSIFIVASVVAIGIKNSKSIESNIIGEEVVDKTMEESEQAVITEQQSYAENQGSEKSIEIASSNNRSTNDNEYFNNYLEVVDEKVTITPYNVYYDNGKVVVNAYIYNGFSYEIFNINNIKIQLENETTKIAEATFGELENVELAPKSFIEWTFTFSEDEVVNSNASLNTLYWNNSCNYSHQGFYLVSR